MTPDTTGRFRPIRDLQAQLGPTVLRLVQHAPVWSERDIPSRWHRCNRYSRRGLTKQAPQVYEHSPRGLEVCPCGGSRTLENGKPYGKWIYKNMARRDPHWWTRADRPPPS